MANIVGNLPVQAAVEDTNNYFEQFFKGRTSVSAATNDALVGFFQSFTGNKESGKMLAGTVLYTAAATGTDPLVILDELRRIKSSLQKEIKVPLPSTQFVSLYNNYQEVEENKNEYEPGKVFYVPSQNVFYELDANRNLQATTKYKAESVTNPRLGNVVLYNYFEITYELIENELNAYLTMFLNLNRVGTSLLGINNTPPVSKYVSRTILA